jgi:hypothetical protein
MHLAFRFRMHSLACIAAIVHNIFTDYTHLFAGMHFSSDADVDVTDAMAIDLDLESVFEFLQTHTTPLQHGNRRQKKEPQRASDRRVLAKVKAEIEAKKEARKVAAAVAAAAVAATAASTSLAEINSAVTPKTK